MESTIVIRIDKTEKDAIKKAADAAGMDLSKYVRYRLSGCPVNKNPAMIQEIQWLRQEVARIGNNINQIARAQNAYLFSVADKESLKNDMVELNRAMSIVIDAITTKR